MTPSEPQLLSTCTREALGDGNFHALVWGRCRIWNTRLSDTSQMQFHWSKWAWWKAMYYPHRGSTHQKGWGIYAGQDGYTGPGDAEITHWMQMPVAPTGAPTGDTP